MLPLTRSRHRARFFGDASTLEFDFISAAALDSRITFTRASSATRFNSSGVLETVGNDVARLDFNPATLEAQGLLIEEQRTNLALNSEDLTAGSWNKSNVTVTANSTIAPNGTVTADSMLETTGTDGHLINIATAITFTTATQSFYVKPNGRTNVALRTIIGANDWVAVVFNLTGNGSVTQTSVGSSSPFSGISGTIANAGNGWYRISMTMTQPSRNVFTGIVDLCTTPTPTLRAVDGVEVYTGDVTKGVYVWGAQFEIGSFPTSYIPTVASSVTRAADVASVNTLTPWFNAAAGTLFAEVVGLMPNTLSGNRAFASLSDNTYNNSISLMKGSGISEWRNEIYSSGSAQASFVFATYIQSAAAKLAIAYQANDANSAVNGTVSTTDTTVTVPTVNKLELRDPTGASGGQPTCYLRRITYYPRRLADAQLQQITA